MDAYTKDRVRRLLMFLLSLGIAAGITFLVKEPEFTQSQVYVLFLLMFAIGLWLTEAIPAFAVSLFIIAFLVFALGNEYINESPEDIAPYVNTFSSSVIWLMLGGFFLASAMVVTAIMPLLASLGKNSGFSKAILLGIPIAAATGGMGTIIGTPPNAIAAGALENAGMPIDFIDWMKYGVPLTIVLTAICGFVLIRMFLKGKTPISLDFLKNQQQDSSPEFTRQRRVVIVVIIFTVGLWLTSSLHGIKTAAVCAIPLVILTLTRVLDGKDIRELPWDTLLLVAGGLSLGIALEQSGLLNHYAEKLITAEINSILLMFIFAYITMLVSNIMSNTAASTVMIPLGMAIMVGQEKEIALIIAFAASTAMFLPVSSPPNAIAFSTGLLEQKDFRVGGLLVGLLGPLLAILWVLLITYN